MTSLETIPTLNRLIPTTVDDNDSWSSDDFDATSSVSLYIEPSNMYRANHGSFQTNDLSLPFFQQVSVFRPQQDLPVLGRTTGISLMISNHIQPSYPEGESNIFAGVIGMGVGEEGGKHGYDNMTGIVTGVNEDECTSMEEALK